MNQQLSFFEEPKKAHVKREWSPWTCKRDKWHNRIGNYNLDETWRPAPGDIVEYSDNDGRALVDGVSWFVGWWSMAYVLEVVGDVALLYFPKGAFYDFQREWVGIVSAHRCWPTHHEQARIPEFLKTELNPAVSDIYPAIADRRSTWLEMLEPPKDLFGNSKDNCNVKTHSKTVRRKSP